MNECLRGTKLEEIEISKDCLEYGVGPEAETPPEEEDVGSEGDSMGSEEQRKQSPSSWMKFTYKSPKGKSPVRNSDWKDMSILDLEEDPFPAGTRRVGSCGESILQDGGRDQGNF